jgi:hypothetical protein
MSVNEIRLVIAIRAYCYVLLLGAIGFIAIHCGLIYYHNEIAEIPWLIRQLFDLDEENNLPTWFSSFLLLNNALLLYLLAQSSIGADRNYRVLLAAGFLVLSIDEVAGLHESLNTAIDINWAIPGGILVLLVGIVFVPFLLSLQPRLAVLYLVSGLLYVSGAICVELLSEDMDEESLAYGFATALEEGLEMFGALLFLTINFAEMKRQQQVRIAFKTR